MKIGILGGTFDPVHKGHLYIAQETKKCLGLAQVWLMPAARSPFKQEKKTASFEQRFQMIQQAVQYVPGCFATQFEGLRGGISYTVDTLQALCCLHPQDEFWFIIGADAYAGFFQWKNPQKILELVHLAVVSRPGCEIASDLWRNVQGITPGLAERIHELKLEGMEVSSTYIRQCMERGEDEIQFLLPETLAYIRKNGLYKQDRLNENDKNL